MQVYTETGYIYPEALKLLMLLTDLMNGFIYEIGNLAQQNPRTVGHVAFILPGTIYALSGSSYIILYLVRFSREPSIVRALKCTMGISSIIGLCLYLVGDNYYLIEQIERDEFIVTLNNVTLKNKILNQINTIQPSFLLLSIMFHRAIPQILKIFIRKFQRDIEYNDSFFIGTINALVLTTELDSWFTMVQSTNNCSSQLKWVWAMWFLMIAVYTALLVINGVVGFSTGYRDSGAFQGCCGGLVVVFTVITFGFYLLGDNRQPLDCYLSNAARSSTKLLFVIIAGIIYTTVSIFYVSCFIKHPEMFSEEDGEYRSGNYEILASD